MPEALTKSERRIMAAAYITQTHHFSRNCWERYAWLKDRNSNIIGRCTRDKLLDMTARGLLHFDSAERVEFSDTGDDYWHPIEGAV